MDREQFEHWRRQVSGEAAVDSDEQPRKKSAAYGQLLETLTEVLAQLIADERAQRERDIEALRRELTQPNRRAMP